jgi:uncharacterized protein (UPF0262 family)
MSEDQNTELVELELDDETAVIAEYLAKERGVTVEELIRQVLMEAVEEFREEE